MQNIEIVPSLLSADFGMLAQEIQKVERAGCRRLHLDIMDGHFAPNITIGPVVIKAIRKRTKLYLETHLMVDLPERYLNDLQQAGVDCIIVHQEACCDFVKTIKKIKRLGLDAGIALRPGTAVKSIRDIMKHIDMILIMTVEPGFGGQPFIRGTEKKIIHVRHLLQEQGLNILIGVDGGINVKTAPLVARAGATHLIAGNSIFHGDVVKNIKSLYKSVS